MARTLYAVGVLAAIGSQILNTPAHAALESNYDHDGKTTYCWHINQPASNATLGEADRPEGFAGTEGCPIAMTVAIDSTTVEVNSPVNMTWTVDANFNRSNLVNMTKLAYGKDLKGRTAQIVHSNLHSCVFQSGCDPFKDGEQLENKTPNQVANLTDNIANFEETVQFGTAGVYSVLAHIIMPDTNSSRQFAYAVYIELTVKEASEGEATEAPSTTTDSGGISQAAVIGIVVGGVVVVVALLVVAVAVWRRQGNHGNINDMSNYSYPPPPPYDAASELYSIDPKDNTAGSDAGTARVTGSWSAPANSLPSRSLDGTNGSNRSGASHQAARDSRPGYTGYAAYGGDYRPTEGAGRSRRVDSDMEL
ncbi:hypothetical protein G195_008536 [Phytophthora kernoviae 00238/432]|uniref:Uncharacterized protein n=1 Tax=Phytophthora kernoviae 00238/432 TaxID=1284355 RepID=A0A8J4SBK1_9STRA|nr:hypothetical protein G195_008536 [Phytophthora kernoviae 00238/432]